MNLNNELLKELCEKISKETKVASYIIEKDYYVTMLLKEIFLRDNNFVFKGGTSLSKCYKLINRFSEDIDLNYNYYGKIPGTTKRIVINQTILDAAKSCKFSKVYPSKINAENDYIKYIFEYRKIFNGLGYIKPSIEVETAFFIDSDPTDKLKANSIIGEYLLHNNMYEIIEKYKLEEFEVNVQSYVRTFVDKVIAICDYYYEKRNNFTSRHLYDLFKINQEINYDKNFVSLFNDVKKKRIEKHLGAQHKCNESISKQLQKIIESNFYKSDYNKNTIAISIEKVSYDDVIRNLIKIKNNIEKIEQ